MAGTIVVDRLESDASYASSINVASPLVISNTTTVNGNVNIDSGLIFVDAVSNRVAIGNTLPTTTFYVGNPSDANQSIRFDFNTSSNARINSTRAGNGATQSLHILGQDTINFFTAGTERLRIPSDAAGITFPAAQAASSDPNTLDDYEEGTFSPTYTSSGISAVTYGNNVGFYTKIGRFVMVTINIMTNSVTVTNSSAQVFIGNLPFTSISNSESLSSVSIATSSRFTSNPPGSGWVAINSTQIALFRASTSFITGEDPTNITCSDLVTTGGNRNTVRLTAIYFAAS